MRKLSKAKELATIQPELGLVADALLIWKPASGGVAGASGFLYLFPCAEPVNGVEPRWHMAKLRGWWMALAALVRVDITRIKAP